MPTESHRFPADGPIHLDVRSNRGSVRVEAGTGPETTVDVSGRHDGPLARVDASEDGRRVTVDATRPRWFGNAPRIDIVVHLPEGSSLHIDNASASVDASGRFADAEVRTASGTVAIAEVTGDAHVRSASGEVRLGTVGGATRLESASGNLLVATAGAACSAKTASGAIDVGWAQADVSARSASGNVTVRDAVRGTVSVNATSGNVAVGVRRGTLVWLDLTTVSGRTTSDLNPDAPRTGDPEDTLELRVRTVSGNISVSPSGVPSGGAGSDDRRQPA